MQHLNFKIHIALALFTSVSREYCKDKSGVSGRKSQEPLLYIILHCFLCVLIILSKIVWTPVLIFLITVNKT